MLCPVIIQGVQYSIFSSVVHLNHLPKWAGWNQFLWERFFFFSSSPKVYMILPSHSVLRVIRRWGEWCHFGMTYYVVSGRKGIPARFSDFTGAPSLSCGQEDTNSTKLVAFSPESCHFGESTRFVDLYLCFWTFDRQLRGSIECPSFVLKMRFMMAIR